MSEMKLGSISSRLNLILRSGGRRYSMTAYIMVGVTVGLVYWVLLSVERKLKLEFRMEEYAVFVRNID